MSSSSKRYDVATSATNKTTQHQVQNEAETLKLLLRLLLFCLDEEVVAVVADDVAVVVVVVDAIVVGF